MANSKRQSKRTGTARSQQRVVSRRGLYLATFYQGPEGGTKFVLPGQPDVAGIELASQSIGCKPVELIVRRRWVTNKYLNELPEYDG